MGVMALLKKREELANSINIISKNKNRPVVDATKRLFKRYDFMVWLLNRNLGIY